MSIPWLLVSGDFVKTGGMDVANYALASYLARSGHEVHLVAHRADPSLLRIGNVTVHEAAKPLNSYYLGRKHLDRLGRIWAERISARGGRVVVNGGNCLWGDVNWVHYVHAAYQPEVAGMFRRAVHAWKRQAFLQEEREAILSAKVVIANSHRTRHDLIEKLGVHPHRIETVFYGVDPQTLRPADEREREAFRVEMGWPTAANVALFVGALGDRRKGFDVVFDAWRMLRQRHGWDVRLLVVGRGAEAGAWEVRVKAGGMGEMVKFLGFRDDVPRIVRAVDVLVAPARYEPYGLGVHEALCSGVPAVVSESSGVTEQMGALSQLFVSSPEDPGELARRLLEWRDGRERFGRVAADLSATLRRWTWDDMAATFVRAVTGESEASAGETGRVRPGNTLRGEVGRDENLVVASGKVNE